MSKQELHLTVGQDVWFAYDWDWKVVHAKCIRGKDDSGCYLVKYDHCSNPEMLHPSLSYCFTTQREAWNYLLRASRKAESKAKDKWVTCALNTTRLQQRKKDALALERRKKHAAVS